MVDQIQTLIGIVLSDSTINLAKAQVFGDAVKFVKAGSLVKIIEDTFASNYILAKISGIKYIHKYLEEGDIFSFARTDRKAVDNYRRIIQRHGLSYIVISLELLNEVSINKNKVSLISISKPPKPGSFVALLRKDDLLKLVIPEVSSDFDILNKGFKGKIGFGKLYGYAEKAPFILNVNNITMHLAIVGTTGSGKSYTTGYLIEQLSRIFLREEHSINKFLGVPILVFDANGDYLDYLEEPSMFLPGHKEYVILTKSRKGYIDVDIREPTIDLNMLSDRDVARLIILYHKGYATEGQEQQIGILSRIIEELRSLGMDLNEIIATEKINEIIDYFNRCRNGDRKDCFERNLLKHLNIIRASAQKIYRILSDTHKMTLDAIVRALNTFTNDLYKQYKIITRSASSSVINKTFFERITDPFNPHFVVVDFSSEGMPGIPLKVKQTLVYFVLSVAYQFFTEIKQKGKQRLLVIIIEEAQNYAPNTSLYPIPFSIAKDMLATIATQGRKFGLSLVIVTQRPSFVDPIVMSMVNSWIIHRISPSDIDFVLRASGGLPKYMIGRLVKLERGTAIITGQMNCFHFPVLVSFYDMRRNKLHKAGTFNIEEVLKSVNV